MGASQSQLQVSPARAEIVVADDLKASHYAEVRNPARVDEVVGEYALGDQAAVDAAVAAATRAAPAWAALPATERARRLIEAAERLGAGLADRAQLMTREQGKVLWESRLDVGGAPWMLRYYAGLAEDVEREQIVEDHRGTTIVRRRPLGPTVVIVPWNAPVYLCLMAVAPALTAGNPVIVKPSEFAPLTITHTLSLLAAALPEGVVGVVPGLGSEVGAALVAHPGVRKVIFTGGTATGREILRNAANTIKSVSLELGGNDPAIVLDSAPLDDAMLSEIRQGVFTNSGQVCFNIKRIYVQRSVYPEFLDKLRSAVDEIAVGDGLDQRSTIGPLNNRRQFESVKRLIELTRQSGARVEELGSAVDPGSWSDGYFLRPAVVTDLPHESALVANEQFGPVVPVVPFDDLDQAIRWANDSEYGLAASIWSADVNHALTIARRIEAGSVFVNSHRIGSSDMTVPFGGVKQSGLGRNHGVWGIDEVTEPQAISHRPDTSTFPGPQSV